ncbi:MAG: phosphatase PAP2 family protein [Bacteroidota bacterium]
MKKRTWNSYILCICMVGLGCTQEQKDYSAIDLTTSWAEMALYITQFTPANSPTFASRCLGYIGLTMYESVVHGYESHNSLAGQVNGLATLPLPNPDEAYSWELALNSGQAFILDSIYVQTSDENKAKIDSLENVFYRYYSQKIKDQERIDRSVAFGKEIAKAIFQWSKTDGGHRGYLRNFDKDLVHPERPGSWKPPLYAQSFSHHPLHPHWGENRTFVAINGEIPTPEMIPYDTTAGSPYYQQFYEVYQKEQELTQQEKETAIWWSDDPDDTFTPPGHSYYLATIGLEMENASLIQSAETYARVGMAVADAFIMCWKWKYHHFSERPNTFVPRFIDQSWESFWPDPPFPSFPSGHAIQAAAAAVVLTDLMGAPFAFIDSAHVGRERDELRETDFVERSFGSFWEVATETADSRFLGGIHTHQDNQVGLDEGSRIARNVNSLKWRN